MKNKRKKKMPVEFIFCWIGANESVVDSICPKLGMALGKQFRIRNLFCNGSNIKVVNEQIKEFKRDKNHNYKIIAFDVGLCKQNTLMLRTKGIRPASAIKKQDIKIGDISYIINIDKCFNHIKDRQPIDLILNNYSDKRVIKQRNKIISRMYKKLYDLIVTLNEPILY